MRLNASLVIDIITFECERYCAIIHRRDVGIMRILRLINVA